MGEGVVSLLHLLYSGKFVLQFDLGGIFRQKLFTKKKVYNQIIMTVPNVTVSFNFTQIFQGNTEMYTVVYHDLNPIIEARYIRVLPTNWYGYIAMRMELYTC